MSSQLLKKKYTIIHNEYIKEIELGLKYIQEILEKQYEDHRVQNFFVKAFYTLILKGKAKKNIIKEIEFILKLILDENFPNYSELELKIDELTEKYYPEYTKNEFFIKYLDKKHERFKELSDIIKADFRMRILNLSKLLYSEGNNYLELVTHVFKNKETVESVLESHLIPFDKLIDIVEENKEIITVPFYDNVSKSSNIDYVRQIYEYIIQAYKRLLKEFEMK